MKLYIPILVLLTLAISTPALAQQDVDVNVTVQPRVVSPGDTLRYTVEVSVQGNYDINLQEPPNFDAFQVVGTSSAPSFFVQGGQATRSLTLQYTLRAPGRPGEYTIGPPRITVGTRQFTLPARDIRVSQQAPSPDPTPDRPAATPSSPETAFIEIVVEPERSPYVGEQINLRYDLLVSQQGPRYRPQSPGDPPLDDFWVEELSQHLRSRGTFVRRGGRQYTASPIRMMALFPLREGPATIDGIEVPLVRSSFFGPDEQITATAQPIEINVRPLPPGAPDGFSDGNVGQWRLSVDQDTAGARVGGQIQLTARLEGTGRPNRLGEPRLVGGDAFEVIATTDAADTTTRGGVVGGWRTFTWRLMPLEEGRQPLPEVVFAYFDPEREEYIEDSVELGAIDVGPGTLPERQEAPTDPDVPTEPPFTDSLHDPLPDGELTGSSAPTGPPWWVFALPLAGLLLLLLEAPIRRRRSPQAAAKKRRKLLRKSALEALGTDTTATPERALKSLRLVLTEGFGARQGALTVDEVRQLGSSLELSPDLTNSLTDLVADLTRARYGGGTPLPSDQVHSRTSELIDALLDHLKAQPTPTAPTGTSAGATATSLILAITIATFATPLANASDTTDLTTLYNDGTAAAHAGDLGQARLHFERALARGADHPSLHHNLTVVIDQVARESPGLATFPSQDFAATGIPARLPAAIAVFLWLALVFTLAMRFDAGNQKLWRTGLITALALAIVASLAIAQARAFERDADLAIVIAPGTHLHSGPSPHASKVLDDPLPPGAVLRLHETQDRWHLMETPMGHRGWLPAPSSELIAP